MIRDTDRRASDHSVPAVRRYAEGHMLRFVGSLSMLIFSRRDIFSFVPMVPSLSCSERPKSTALSGVVLGELA